MGKSLNDLHYSHIYLLRSGNARKRDRISIFELITINSEIKKKNRNKKQVFKEKNEEIFFKCWYNQWHKILISTFDRLKPDLSCPSMQKSSFLSISFQSRLSNFTKIIDYHQSTRHPSVYVRTVLYCFKWLCSGTP